MKPRLHTAGFSLVEMIVYIAVLLVISVASIQSMLSLDTLIKQYSAERQLTRSAITALERFIYDARDAETVFSVTSGQYGDITFTIDGQQVSYATSGDALHVSVAGVDQGPLTLSGVVVDTVAFYAYDDVSEFARVELQLTSTVGEYSLTRTYRAGATLRESYAP